MYALQVRIIVFVLHLNHLPRYMLIHTVNKLLKIENINDFVLGNVFDYQALAKRLWGDMYYNAKT